MKQEIILFGTYQHYRTKKRYKVIGFALHSETHEEMVIYKALYSCEKFGHHQIWVRPKNMFLEQVMHDGCTVPRFKYIEEQNKNE